MEEKKITLKKKMLAVDSRISSVLANSIYAYV